ncbi:tRNA pseudouridine(38-40) synthase TruA [bacterium]|nr:tRNA pseudouridine(38-40) synthase TruA [bacterium]
MRNIKLTIEYNGSGFYGWQAQPSERTVQGEIVKVVSKLAGHRVKVTGAGRTDAGVHAVGQVANFHIESDHSAGTIKKALNGLLPHDILIRDAVEAPLSFHARYDARSKTYNYIFILKKTALWRGFYLQVTENLDIDAMRYALSRITGERDFASFASASDVKTTNCRIISASLNLQQPLLTISLKANRFLYNMVRTIAGTILEIGKGRNYDVDEIINARDRSLAGPNLPPHALYLMEVAYDPPLR